MTLFGRVVKNVTCIQLTLKTRSRAFSPVTLRDYMTYVLGHHGVHVQSISVLYMYTRGQRPVMLMLVYKVELPDSVSLVSRFK